MGELEETNQLNEDQQGNTEEKKVEQPQASEEKKPENSSKEVDVEATSEEKTDDSPQVQQKWSDHKGHQEGEEEDEAEDENDTDEDTQVVNVDFSNLTKAELIEEAGKSLNLPPAQALKRIKEVRSYFEEILRQEKREALQAYIEQDNDPDDFKFDQSADRDAFQEIYQNAKTLQEQEKKRIEEEKRKNYQQKKDILEKLKSITETDETEESLNQVKELQNQWKQIRAVPKEKMEALWDEYHLYINKFYDNHSIYIELKELDREKNLETKIELCKKVDEIKSESSLKTSFILLRKYREEFFNTGPVPRKFAQEIYDRFKNTCDEVYTLKKEELDKKDAERKENLEKKKILIEKAHLIGSVKYDKAKVWNQKSADLNTLMEEWKTIGPVPLKDNQKVWKEFRSHFNNHYALKKEYFGELNKARKANLILKEDLCKKAEEIASSDEFKQATRDILKLQDEWKSIGPVPDKVSNAIWKRFRAACDKFFERKGEFFEGRKSEQDDNLKLKEELITAVDALKEKDLAQGAIVKELKEIQKKWTAIGFVPFKKKDAVQNAYKKATDELMSKFDINKENIKQSQLSEHYSNLVDLPDGKKRLEGEKHKIRKMITAINSEISTLENNMEFFSRSANAQKFKKDFEQKTDKAKGRIEKLKGELQTINKIIKEKFD